MKRVIEDLQGLQVYTQPHTNPRNPKTPKHPKHLNLVKPKHSEAYYLKTAG
jgi:hypothetical protein